MLFPMPIIPFRDYEIFSSLLQHSISSARAFRARYRGRDDLHIVMIFYVLAASGFSVAPYIVIGQSAHTILYLSPQGYSF
jgi:hypothetical protein